MRYSSTIIIPSTLIFLFSLLSASEYLTNLISREYPEVHKIFILTAIELLAFLIPYLVLVFFKYKDEERVSYRISSAPFHALWFIFFSGLALAICAFLSNGIMYNLSVSANFTTDIAFFASSDSLILNIIFLALIPAIMGEVLFRGAIFSLLQQNGLSTLSAVLLSSLFFAMVNGSIYNFVGPFIAGIFYAFLTYWFGTISASIFAHFMSNLLILIMNGLIDSYFVIGFWNYILGFLLIIGLFLLRIALGRFAVLIEQNKIKSTEKGSKLSFLSAILNPAFICFAVLFSLKAVFNLF